ncbi:hypothetical protein Lokhon_02066 [Limimaricola hongkongensis DSM 17492]|uniref:Uncharacterized protein n=1 Tax=Limimaricola hongkongensis DSM 17492 TaxID=1122180 RepID=A0A017HDY0_9RHOB|nr:hypothetical protein Lokhon_02066 [Limimaricola hongkongensis DSM 17492]
MKIPSTASLCFLEISSSPPADENAIEVSSTACSSCTLAVAFDNSINFCSAFMIFARIKNSSLIELVTTASPK